MELENARVIAEELTKQFEGACRRIEIVGDIRRQKPKVGKIKLLCIPSPVKGEPIPTEHRDLLPLLSSQAWLPEFDDTDAIHQRVMELMQEEVLDFTSAGSRTYSITRKSILHIPSGIAVDILSTDEQCWAVALVVATGGAKTNRRFAAAARERGWRFRASGDGFDTPDGHITCSTEQEVFEEAGLPYLPPEQRE